MSEAARREAEIIRDEHVAGVVAYLAALRMLHEAAAPRLQAMYETARPFDTPDSERQGEGVASRALANYRSLLKTSMGLCG